MESDSAAARIRVRFTFEEGSILLEVLHKIISEYAKFFSGEIAVQTMKTSQSTRLLIH